MPAATFIALLRGINVSGHNKIPMADLRSLGGKMGWQDVRTYIQSGNVVFRAESTCSELETALEQAIEERFGFVIPVIVRSAAAWQTFLETNPFPEASESEPNRVMLALSQRPPLPDAVERLRERANEQEPIEQIGEALWIHFGDGAGKSRLSPVVFDRAVGSPVTLRNWRTVRKLGEMTAPGE